MRTYIALLRGINVGGFTFPMEDLRNVCREAGLENVRTYIQSGNVLFESDKNEKSLCTLLEATLETHKDKHIPVIMRTSEDIKTVMDNNPFPNANPSRVGVLFLSKAAPGDLIEQTKIPGREEIAVSGREIYIHYPDGMGRSKLKLPKTVKDGTMRNINTVAKLWKLSRE